MVAGVRTYADFAEPFIEYVAPMDGTLHPGAKHILRGSIVSDVLSAGGPGVAGAPDACARGFVVPLGVVREVVMLNHVLRMGPGGCLEGGIYAERLQAVVLTGVVVQGEHPLLRGVQEDLILSAPAGIALARRLRRRVYAHKACGRKKDGDGDNQQTPHGYIPLSLYPAFQPVSTSSVCQLVV